VSFSAESEAALLGQSRHVFGDQMRVRSGCVGEILWDPGRKGTVWMSRLSGSRAGPPTETRATQGGVSVGGDARSRAEGVPGDVVAFLTEMSDPGGSEAVLARLAKDLREREHEVVGILGGEGWLGQELRESRVPFCTTDLWVGARWRAVRSVLALRRLIRSRGVGLVISWTFTTHVLAALALSGTRCVFIPNVRGLGYERATRMRGMLWRRLIAPRAEKVICVSAAVRDELTRHAPGVSGKAMVIPNGVDLDSRASAIDRTHVRDRLGVPEGCFLIGSVGRVHPVKGHADLVTAAARLARDGSAPFQVIIAGYPVEPWATELAGLARTLGVEHLVHFLGHRSDVPELLAAMDAFVLPSHSEGMPNALLEAMAAGKPVVATRVGGSAEVIRDGRNGLLVAPQDADALAAAIARLRADPASAALLGAAAQRDVAANYSWAGVLGSYDALLRSLR
jgi:glycosyltransferase involved in cell wall biosynthesis